jgi:hypothetical protein
MVIPSCPVCKSKDVKVAYENNGMLGPGGCSYIKGHYCTNCGVILSNTRNEINSTEDKTLTVDECLKELEGISTPKRKIMVLYTMAQSGEVGLMTFIEVTDKIYKGGSCDQ